MRLAASHVVVALQSIVARNVNPVDMAVVSVTSMLSATDTHNVIVDEMKLRGTIRTLRAEVRENLVTRMQNIAASTETRHSPAPSPVSRENRSHCHVDRSPSTVRVASR